MSDKNTGEGFSAEERAAMKERAAELRGTKAGAKRADGEKDVLEKIAEMSDHDRQIAERIHVIATEHAPELWPKTWYGQPAYARDGKEVVFFFQAADKFKTRYANLGFSDAAKIDDGAIWATSFAVVEWTPEAEARIIALVEKSVS